MKLSVCVLKEIKATLANWLCFCLPVTLCLGDSQFVFPFTKRDESCKGWFKKKTLKKLIRQQDKESMNRLRFDDRKNKA